MGRYQRGTSSPLRNRLGDGARKVGDAIKRHPVVAGLIIAPTTYLGLVLSSRRAAKMLPGGRTIRLKVIRGDRV